MKYFKVAIVGLLAVLLFSCFSFSSQNDSLYSLETVYQAPDSGLLVEDPVTVNLVFTQSDPPDTGELYKYKDSYPDMTYSGLMAALNRAVSELFPNGTVIVNSEETGDIQVEFEWLQPQFREIESLMTIDMIWQGRIATEEYSLAIKPSVLTTGEGNQSTYSLGMTEMPGWGEAVGKAVARVAEEIAYTYINGVPEELLVYEDGSVRWMQKGEIDYAFPETEIVLPESVLELKYLFATLHEMQFSQALISDYDNNGTLNLITLEMKDDAASTMLYDLDKDGDLISVSTPRPSINGRMIVLDQDNDGKNELFYYDPADGILYRESYALVKEESYSITTDTFNFNFSESAKNQDTVCKEIVAGNISGNEKDILMRSQLPDEEMNQGILFIDNKRINFYNLEDASMNVFADLDGDSRDDLVHLDSMGSSWYTSNITVGLSNGTELDFDRQPGYFLNAGMTMVYQGADDSGGYMSHVSVMSSFSGAAGIDLNGDNRDELLVISSIEKKLYVLGWKDGEFFLTSEYSLPFMPKALSTLETSNGFFIDLIGEMEDNFSLLRIEASREHFIENYSFYRVRREDPAFTVNGMISTPSGVYFTAKIKNEDTGLSELVYYMPGTLD